MSTAHKPYYSCRDAQEEMRNGDCMSQKEFHRRYETMPEGFRAELLDGTVFVSEPVSQAHGNSHALLISTLYAYSAETPGLTVECDATVILGKKDEVQPDVVLRIQPAYSGQTQVAKRGKATYIEGPPELVAEVAYSSRAIDLHLKRQRYALARVTEYLVLCLKPKEIHWFDLMHSCSLLPDADGVICSRVFPGLWIDSDALLQMDYHQVMAVLKLGLTSPEHQAFVERLAASRKQRG